MYNGILGDEIWEIELGLMEEERGGLKGDETGCHNGGGAIRNA